MSLFDSIGNGIKGHLDKKKEEREFVERLQRETLVQKREIFEEEFKRNALEVAKSQAKKEAAQKSGLQKLRAQNRSRRLNNDPVAPGSFFEKLRDFTQKNKSRMHENLERTAMMRKEAEKIKQENFAKRQTPMVNRPMSQGTWKM